MLSLTGQIFQRLRLIFDPSWWLVCLLGLKKYERNQKEPGLILIQIDGLAHRHFEKAVKNGYLPFLKKLQKNEHYRLWHQYSGLPSSTPSIQAELFYGAKQYVPAFKFQDHKTGSVFTFYDSKTAGEVERRLHEKGAPLLKGGSSYGNIYRGGAESSHFCITSIGWKNFFGALKPGALFFLFLFNFFHAVRISFYLVLEVILGIFDSVRGTLMGFGFREEVQFILSRLVVTVCLRELSTLAVKMDITRGLPVIHVNFFGYDDQAHRRGPSSRFAYWALRGIDDAVKSIWSAAQNALNREYEVWIYSDHGQEEVTPYRMEAGETIERAVKKVFESVFRGEDLKPSVAAQGPVGFIYAQRKLRPEEKEKTARELVLKARVPLVLAEIGNKCFGFNGSGKFSLPEESSEIIGKHHPYLEEAGQELENLCRHKDSGEFVICGWRKGKKPVSFPMEYGSHGGPGPIETDGFVLMPADIRIETHGKKYLRPLILRKTGEDYLKGQESVFYGTDPGRQERRTLRVMSYNTHGCIGMDGKLSPERIARVIARHDPDIIALQELDSGRMRSGKIDQAGRIAELLGMEHHFHAVQMVEDQMYGNAVLSRYPLKVIRSGTLPRWRQHRFFEPRGVLWAEVECFNARLQFLNTHLSFWGHEQTRQAEALCGAEWLGGCPPEENIVLCGDFNALPASKTCGIIQNSLKDVQLKLQAHKPLNTWFGNFPLGRIDHVFVSGKIQVLKIEVPANRLEKLASDHLPLIAELKIPVSCRASRRENGSFAYLGQDSD